MAYFCLTVVEERAGGRDKAAGRYAIEPNVLKTLGRLTSTVGDDKEARKAKGRTERRPHTGAEKAWIEAAVRALIRRAGEWASDPRASLPQIIMSDLPRL
jgi:hypothetical protein